MYSVVIPTYNSVRTIQKTIESVLTQTIPAKKIYVIDDLSDDLPQLKCILESYGSIICLVESAVKTNAANNRNRGWALAHEKFVFFLDSDDEWLPFHAEEVINIFNADILLDCVCTAFLVKESNGNSYTCNSTILDMKKVDNPLDLFFTGHFDFRSSCIALKKETYDRVRFDPFLKKHQDWDLFLSLVTNAISIERLTKPTVQINEIGNNRMSAKNNLEASFYFIKKWECYQNKFNFDRLCKMFYVSACNNNAAQEVKTLNDYLSRTRNDMISPAIRIFSFVSELSFFLAKKFLSKWIFIAELKRNLKCKYSLLRLFK